MIPRRWQHAVSAVALTLKALAFPIPALTQSGADAAQVLTTPFPPMSPHLAGEKFPSARLLNTGESH